MNTTRPVAALALGLALLAAPLANACPCCLHRKAASARTATAPANTFCPIKTTRAADPAVTVTFNGKKIGFCCAVCRTKFLALSPKAQAGAVAVVLP